MSYADLTFTQWSDLSDGAARRLAEEIADRHGLTVPVGLQDAVYAGRSHRVALFERDGMRFALVPGGRPTLGHDAARFRPTSDQMASYADSAAEYGLPQLAEYVDAMTSPARTVELPAMLVAVEAFDPCEVSLAPDDPRVLRLLTSEGAELDGVSQFRSAGGLTVEFDRAGQVARARAITDVSYDDAMTQLASAGLRTTTADEWEWACGAGAATLFRWGDDCPNDGYPYDHKTGTHREANLWGLTIGQDPYMHEVTTERTIVCGGDGGSTTCGGSGFFLGWLALATAYRDEDFGQWLASDDGYAEEILTRPVLELSEQRRSTSP
ncbi:hypothetical protein NIE79_004308 [Micromonospora sp. NIE79]|uniref:Sulfatase-modifying factor enzyme domain-containing protein n=1 Tax=Micromonospora trifolii TaxID=2911208 RepID=A0ABS9N760_9ACTN|nr:hypothetical protein [Micromonospora trifolii]MCG5445786.1 hypothetical protein [Micromonospora trifolii]